MVQALTDMHIIDGYANTFPTDSAAKKTYALYQSVFKKYNTDSINFKRSIDYYTKKPDQLKQIYVQVTSNIDNLQKAEEKRLEDIRKKEEKARQDSLKKVEEKKRKEELQKKFKSKKIMKKDSTKTQEIKKQNDLSGERKR